MFLQPLANDGKGFSKKLEMSRNIHWFCSNNFVQSWTNHRLCYQTRLSRSEKVWKKVVLLLVKWMPIIMENWEFRGKYVLINILY
jgi:hypothetical protein